MPRPASAFTNKAQWPSDLTGYSIGKDGYLVVSFDQGEHWYDIETARDVTLNFSVNTVDTTCRRSGMYRAALPVIVDMSVDAEMLFDANDPIVMELVEQSQSNGIFLIGVFNDGGNGPMFYGCATDMTRSEPTEDVVKLSAKYALTQFQYWFKNKDDVYGGKSSGSEDDMTHPIKNITRDPDVVEKNSEGASGEQT